jgi:hypothetical protein
MKLVILQPIMDAFRDFHDALWATIEREPKVTKMAPCKLA